MGTPVGLEWRVIYFSGRGLRFPLCTTAGLTPQTPDPGTDTAPVLMVRPRKGLRMPPQSRRTHLPCRT